MARSLSELLNQGFRLDPDAGALPGLGEGILQCAALLRSAETTVYHKNIAKGEDLQTDELAE